MTHTAPACPCMPFSWFYRVMFIPRLSLPASEQDKWLDDASENVKRQAFLMKRALDNGDVREALKCASLMTGRRCDACGRLTAFTLLP